MILNFKIMILSLIVLGTIGFLLSIILSKIVFPGITRIASIIAKLIKGKYSLIAIEAIFILTVVTHGSLLWGNIESQRSVMVIFSSFFLTLLLVSNIIYQIRNKSESLPSLFRLVQRRYNGKNYVMNRGRLFLKELASTLFLLVALVVILTFLVELEWSNEMYFAAYIVAPILGVFWSYFDSKLKFRSKESIRFRRIIFYLFIAGLTVHDCFEKYKQLIQSGEITLILDSQSLFTYAGMVIFIALDRIFKELSDDKNDFDKKH